METARITTRFVPRPPCLRIEPPNRGNHPQILRVTCGEKKEMRKLVKGLEKDLALFATMQFGIDPKSGLAGSVQESMITEGAKVLMRQLRYVQEFDEEAKRQRRQEKKHQINSMRTHTEVIEQESAKNSGFSTPVEGSQCLSIAAEAVAQVLLQSLEDHDEKYKQQPDLTLNSSIVSHPSQKHTLQKKVVICMGGKCRNSGGSQLLEQIQRVAANEENVNVVGCKCLGMCKTSPNLRLASSNAAPAICSNVQHTDVVSLISDFLELKCCHNC